MATPEAAAPSKKAATAEPEGFSEEEKELFAKLNIGKEGGVPMPDFIRPSEVRSRSRELSSKIFESWKLLHAVVERHEATLQRRWAGMKSKKKRRELLLQAAAALDGDGWVMPEGHRPDIEHWRDVREGGSEEYLFAKEAPARNNFLWPNLNLEDLSRTETLPALLSARGHNSPHVFSTVDLDRARFGMEALALMPNYLNRYTMMFSGRTTAETYGELVSWEDYAEDAERKWLFERRGIHPGEGLWLLEIQSVTYPLLVNICRKVLHDVPEKELADLSISNGNGSNGRNGTINPTAAMQTEKPQQQQQAELRSHAATVADEPYGVPPSLDREFLLHAVSARWQEAKDHLVALREDPAYFALTMQDWATHRREQLLDANNEPHPVIARNPAAFWSRVVNRAVGSAMLDVAEWGMMVGKMRRLLGLLDSHSKDKPLDPGADLPQDLAFAFYALDYHAEHLKGEPFGNISMGLAASPPMRQYFQLSTPSGPDDKTLAVTAVDTAPSEDLTRLLIRRLGVVQDEKQRQLVGLPAALDELEYLLTTHPDARSKISPWVAAQLSSLSVYALVLRQVELFQPWAARFGADVQDKAVKEALEADMRRSVAGISRLNHHEISDRVTALAMPYPDNNKDNKDTSSRFDYPVDSGRACAPDVAERIRRAEVALDGFWGRLRVELERASAMPPVIKDAFSAPLRRLGVEAAGRAHVKGGAAAAATAASSKAHVVTSAPPGINSRLGKRELKVFNTLFHDALAPSGQQTKPAELPWSEFVHAMHAAGFAVTKMYGSAWLFVPTWTTTAAAGTTTEASGTTDEKKTPTTPPAMMIQEPYTVTNKLSTTASRVIGRRLAWNYGWDRSTFDLK